MTLVFWLATSVIVLNIAIVLGNNFSWIVHLDLTRKYHAQWDQPTLIDNFLLMIDQKKTQWIHRQGYVVVNEKNVKSTQKRCVEMVIE